jgi:hypothetical protein
MPGLQGANEADHRAIVDTVPASQVAPAAREAIDVHPVRRHGDAFGFDPSADDPLLERRGDGDHAVGCPEDSLFDGADSPREADAAVPGGFLAQRRVDLENMRHPELPGELDPSRGEERVPLVDRVRLEVPQPWQRPVAKGCREEHGANFPDQRIAGIGIVLQRADRPPFRRLQRELVNWNVESGRGIASGATGQDLDAVTLSGQRGGELAHMDRCSLVAVDGNTEVAADVGDTHVG